MEHLIIEPRYENQVVNKEDITLFEVMYEGPSELIADLKAEVQNVGLVKGTTR
ncbi:MAG: hypothetical protein ACLFVS_05135 [Candidatus Acetothermia bacterium]